MKKKIFAAAVLALFLASCGGDGGGVDLTDVRVSEPAGPNAALYFTATSDEGDRLTGASTEVATSVQIHETRMDSDGTMAMIPVDALEVLPGEELVLEPGGYHLMLIDAEGFVEGSEIEFILVWETAGELTYTAEVVAPGDTLGDDS